MNPNPGPHQPTTTTTTPTLTSIGPLSPAELNLIADTLNGVGLLITSTPHHMEMLISGGLEHEVRDAIALFNYGEKWSVDAKVLLAKLDAMPRDSKTRLIQLVAQVWERNDDRFMSDLHAFRG